MARDSENTISPLSLSDNGREYEFEKTPYQIKLDHKDPIPLGTKAAALASYFVCNIGLTLYNKAVLGSLLSPWLLTALHTGSATLGCFIALSLGHFKTSRLVLREHLSLLAFSFLFTINIAISNISLLMVTIPFHQIVRATCPIFTTLIYKVYFMQHYPISIYLSLVAVTLGVIITSYGDIMYTTLGFALTLLGVIFAAVKTIVTNRIITGSLAMDHWEVLLRMSSLAFFQAMVVAYANGELHALGQLLAKDLVASSSTTLSSTTQSYSPKAFALILAGNGVLAFWLNVSSFNANRLTGALTMTVCANLKQCLTIALGFCVFHGRMTVQTAVGIMVTVLGGVAYNIAELVSKRNKQKASAHVLA